MTLRSSGEWEEVIGEMSRRQQKTSSEKWKKTDPTMADSVFPTQATAQTRYISLFGTRTRFVIMVLILLCLTSIWSNILAFNFAVICMDDDDGAETAMTAGNETVRSKTHFTSTQNSLAMSIVAIAALLGNFPIVQLVGMVGIRTVFAGLGILSAVSTLLIPLSIRMGFYYFLAVRFLQGFAFAANFPVIGSFCAKWSYFKQNGLFVSSLVAYVQLSPAITMPASGALCDAFKWPSIFYAHGAVSLLLFVTYALFYRNSPQKHPFVGNVELKKISIGKIATVDKRALKKVPYGAILRTPAIWAVWVAAIGNFTCVNMMFLFSPVYLSKVLGFPVHSTGITAALPPFLQFLSKLICGAISDRIKCIPEGIKFRIFNTFAFCGSAAALAVLAFMGDAHKDNNMIVLGVAAGMLGATTGGFFKAGPVLSKQYSHFVTGNISLGITITMLVVPFFVNALTKNNTQEEWKWVFLITGAVMFVTNLFFCIFVKGEPCDWTADNYHGASTVADVESSEARTTTISSISANIEEEDVPEKL